jgi:hypothetical protein
MWKSGGAQRQVCSAYNELASSIFGRDGTVQFEDLRLAIFDVWVDTQHEVYIIGGLLARRENHNGASALLCRHVHNQ